MRRDSSKPPIKILLSKIGLDGHNRGILLVARTLREAGFEVIYLGWHRAPEEIAESALQEDVDLVGISSMADAHQVLVPRAIKVLRERGINMPVIVGGFIQPEDIPELKATGVAEVFRTGTELETIVEWIRTNIVKKR